MSRWDDADERDLDLEDRNLRAGHDWQYDDPIDGHVVDLRPDPVDVPPLADPDPYGDDYDRLRGLRPSLYLPGYAGRPPHPPTPPREDTP